MPRAGLGEAAAAALRAAVSDPDVLERYRAKVLVVPGSECLWWSSAISGRGHGRFWLGAAGTRDIVVIAHRFAWALQHGVDALAATPVLGHRCDNPLCQRVAPGHVVASSYWENRREWALRRHTVGNPLRDRRGASGRARAVRDLLQLDPRVASLLEVTRDGLRHDEAQLPLWPDTAPLDGAHHRLGDPASATGAAQAGGSTRSEDG